MAESAVADRKATGRGNSPRDVEVLRNFVGGAWIASEASEYWDVHNPARGDVIARTPLSNRRDVDRAVAAAKEAFPAWRDTPPVVRARAMFRFKQLLEEISRISPHRYYRARQDARRCSRSVRLASMRRSGLRPPVAHDGLRTEHISWLSTAT